MPRRRTQPPRPLRDEPKRPAPFHSPFRDLAGKLRGPPQAAKPRPLAPPQPLLGPENRRIADRPVGKNAVATRAKRPSGSAAVPTTDSQDERDAFLTAMADVRRLRAEPRIDAPPPALHLERAPVSEEAEALAALCDLVSGAAEFDLSDSTEYVEGAVVGLDPRILRRLRRGQFAYQAYLDLHGMSAAQARLAVESFIGGAVRAGHRCVLIVHGRGHNSKDNVPVLKQHLKSWLARGRIGRAVLAFTSARPPDGGAGALYVLLRRRRGPKEPIDVYEGAKRE